MGVYQTRTMRSFDRISVDPERMGGVPCLRHLRIPVTTVAGLVAEGKSDPEILADYPDLEPDDIRQALACAAEAAPDHQMPAIRSEPDDTMVL
ncbi:MAG: hypothetical protein AMXMBFR13_11730 [Phycisphaerae bacterium]